MSRFAASLEALEQDGAMIEYRKRAVANDGDFDPAEWIAALHEEHFRTLELLREHEGERVARIHAGLQLVLRHTRQADTDLGVTRTALGTVFGETPIVANLRNIARDLRVTVTQTLEAILSEGRS